ncbi:uncharacterized protein [Blastocystis hominis]|uniref:Protein kinase domain-containing protein n=1 Tax=Blastocystis hominis TaxID=12968 RepID=D8MB99_BLAHO|nr:uncharacterized protein [Blastocystis hominis]CBK25338.2 unnamed protein product [Blastocystis hominis]|eukprot:XP_012899386.1 uncharacterized protein [Blastocystis hominis]
MGNIIIYSKTKSRGIANTTTSEGKLIPYQIGNGKYMKTGLARNPKGYMVIKAFQVPSDVKTLRQHEKYMDYVNSKLNPIEQPNLAPFTRFFFDEKTQTEYLVRPYFHSCLDARLNSRPFPSDIEKRWIVYQGLQALQQLHSQNLSHGDIKPENFVVTSTGWVYLTYPHIFVGCLSLEDNIYTYFSYFFTSQKRHACYLAPERIVQYPMSLLFISVMPSGEITNANPPCYTDGTLPPDQPCDIHWSSDIFSMGCVIAEIFTHGQELFDLSSLLRYRSEDVDLSPILNRISDEKIRELVEAMINKNDKERSSAEQYLNRFTNDDSVFPMIFRTMVYPLFRESMRAVNCGSDARIALTPTPMGDHVLEVEEEVDERVPALPFGKESILLVLPLVTASLRSVKYAVSKIYAMRFLTDLSRYLDDEVVLHRILPHLVNVLMEACRPVSPTSEYASAIRCITSVLNCIHTLPRSDFNLVSTYILPAISAAQEKDDYQVKLTVAECLSDIALSGRRLLNVEQKEKIYEAQTQSQEADKTKISVASSYSEDIEQLRDSVRMCLLRALSDSDEESPAVSVQNAG